MSITHTHFRTARPCRTCRTLRPPTASRSRRGFVLSLLSCCIIAAFITGHAATAVAATVEWVKAGGGRWDLAANWSGGTAPNESDDVVVDIDGSGEATSVVIEGMAIVVRSLRAESPVRIKKGSLRTVSGTSLFSKGLTCDDSKLIAEGVQTKVILAGATQIEDCGIQVNGGATVTVRDAESLSTTSPALFSTSGAGSTLDLSSVRVIRPKAQLEIRAGPGSLLDLSGLVKVDNARHNITIIEESQGRLRLESLRDLSGHTTARFHFSSTSIPLPSLEKVTGLKIDPGTETPLVFPALRKIIEAQLVLTGSMVLDMPQLTELIESEVVLRGKKVVFNSGLLTNIRGTSFFLSDGAVYDRVAAKSFDASKGTGDEPRVAVSVEGPGSRLNLSSVQLLISNAPDGPPPLVFRAAKGATLDLSNVRIFQNSNEGGQTKFSEEEKGEILLTGLREIIGLGEFQPHFKVSQNPLPSLEKAEGLTVTLNDQEALSLPALRTLSYGTLSLHPGSSLHVPKLTSVTRSTVTIEGNALFDSANLTDISDTRFFLSSGARFNRIKAVAYNLRTTSVDPTVVVSTIGAGTYLDLSQVKSLSTGHRVFEGPAVLESKDGAVLDLSSITTVEHHGSAKSPVELIEERNGKIRLPPLRLTERLAADKNNRPMKRRLIRGTGTTMISRAKARTIPSTLEEATALLEVELPFALQEKIVRTPKHSLSLFHHGLGTSLRNNWGLRNPSSPLATWFRERGVTDPDDMSGYVMSAFWARQRGMHFSLEAEKALWKMVVERLLDREDYYRLHGLLDLPPKLHRDSSTRQQQKVLP